MTRPSSRLLFLAAALLVGGSARGSSNYPSGIESQLSLSYAPACAICHANGITGYGTVTTDFGLAMRGQGLVCCDTASLDAALSALEAMNSQYITYLKEGLNPNDPTQSAAPPIAYGCFNVTGQGPLPWGGVVFLFALVLFLLRPRVPGR